MKFADSVAPAHHASARARARRASAPRFINMTQAARLSGITPAYIAACVEFGRINGYEMRGKTRVRERYVIDRPSLVDYLASPDRIDPFRPGGISSPRRTHAIDR